MSEEDTRYFSDSVSKSLPFSDGDSEGGGASPLVDDASEKRKLQRSEKSLENYSRTELELNLIPEAELVASVIEGFNSEDPRENLEACQKFVSPKGDIPLPTLLYSLLDSVIECNLVGRILSFLDSPDGPLQLAAGWAISTIARTEPRLLVDKGALPKLIQLLQNPKLIQPAAYALSALASCAGVNEKRLFISQLRDADIITEVDKTLRTQMNQNPINVPVLLALAKLAKSLCYVPKNVKVSADRMRLLPVLCDIFKSVEDKESEILYQIVWSLYYLTKSGKEEVIEEVVVGRNLVPKLVRLVGSALSHHTLLLKPSLNVVGNIISSSIDAHTDAVLFAGILPFLRPLLLDPKWTGEVNWIVSNIAAGNVAQKEELFQGGFLEGVLQTMGSEGLEAGAKEAVYTVLNVMDKGRLAQKQFLIRNRLLTLLGSLVRRMGEEVLTPVVDCVYLLVRTSHRIFSPEEDLISLLNESGVLLDLSKHEDTDNDYVGDKISYILDVGLNNIKNWEV